jgi:hypothetical protein
MKSKFRLMLLIILSLVLTNCSEDDSTTSCADKLAELSQIIDVKTQDYLNNDSEANCIALKNAHTNFYNKAIQCGVADSYVEAYNAIMAIDCSNGNGGGNGGGSSTGTAMIWSQIDHTCGNISVTINGITKIVSSYYSSGVPSCGASGCATFTLSPGTYSVSASCSNKNWNGTITVSANSCSTLRLDSTGGNGGNGGGSTTGNAMVWTQIDHGCGNINVTINGTTKSISSYYSSGAPSCGASGCANFSLNPGTYSVTATCSTKSWNGSVNVTSGGCYKLQLTN